MLAAFALVVLVVDLGRLGLMVSYGHLLVVGVFYACDNLFGLCLWSINSVGLLLCYLIFICVLL